MIARATRRREQAPAFRSPPHRSLSRLAAVMHHRVVIFRPRSCHDRGDRRQSRRLRTSALTIPDMTRKPDHQPHRHHRPAAGQDRGDRDLARDVLGPAHRGPIRPARRASRWSRSAATRPSAISPSIGCSVSAGCGSAGWSSRGPRSRRSSPIRRSSSMRCAMAGAMSACWSSTSGCRARASSPSSGSTSRFSARGAGRWLMNRALALAWAAADFALLGPYLHARSSRRAGILPALRLHGVQAQRRGRRRSATQRPYAPRLRARIIPSSHEKGRRSRPPPFSRSSP